MFFWFPKPGNIDNYTLYSAGEFAFRDNEMFTLLSVTGKKRKRLNLLILKNLICRRNEVHDKLLII